MNMHEKIETALPLRDRLLESELMMRETGCYDGVTDLTLRKHLKLLAAFTTQEQIEIIDRSIGSGWQGLFAPKSSGRLQPS